MPSWLPPASSREFDERTFDVIWCGLLGKLKGIDIFVDVMRAVHQRRGSLRVRILGDGPHRDWAIGQLSGTGVDVQFDGVCNAEQVCEGFSSARLFLFPTRYDPWGLVATEAAQCGTPTLISPAAGAAEDIIRDGIDGFVIDLSDQQRWVDRTMGLLDDRPLWEACSRNGRERTAGLTAEGAAEALTRALVRAVEKKGRKAA